MKRCSKICQQGFTLVELLIVVAGLLCVIALVLPTLARPHHTHGHMNCVNNLKQIGLSFRTWALDNQDKFPMQVSITNGGTMELVENGSAYVHFLVMSNELSTPRILICPAEPESARIVANSFSTNNNGYLGNIPFTNDVNLSYFVGVDTTQEQPNGVLPAMPISKSRAFSPDTACTTFTR
ncbi:MAG TPA: type II secretion system protein, partial [Candidatus Dormibacteraeota bacterium]|nr:type II secretion system protein [Candidatus Dormibacteraeota bacterium]